MSPWHSRLPLFYSHPLFSTPPPPTLLCGRFDMDLNAAKDDSNSEVQAKVRLAREKEQLLSDYNELKEKFKVQTLTSYSCS